MTNVLAPAISCRRPLRRRADQPAPAAGCPRRARDDGPRPRPREPGRPDLRRHDGAGPGTARVRRHPGRSLRQLRHHPHPRRRPRRAAQRRLGLALGPPPCPRPRRDPQPARHRPRSHPHPRRGRLDPGPVRRRGRPQRGRHRPRAGPLHPGLLGGLRPRAPDAHGRPDPRADRDGPRAPHLHGGGRRRAARAAAHRRRAVLPGRAPDGRDRGRAGRHRVAGLPDPCRGPRPAPRRHGPCARAGARSSRPARTPVASPVVASPTTPPWRHVTPPASSVARVPRPWTQLPREKLRQISQEVSDLADETGTEPKDGLQQFDSTIQEGNPS